MISTLTWDRSHPFNVEKGSLESRTGNAIVQFGKDRILDGDEIGAVNGSRGRHFEEKILFKVHRVVLVVLAIAAGRQISLFLSVDRLLKGGGGGRSIGTPHKSPCAEGELEGFRKGKHDGDDRRRWLQLDLLTKGEGVDIVRERQVMSDE